VTPRKWTGRPPGRPRGPKRTLLLVRLEPRQAKELRRLAKARAKETGVRLDVSAIVRELLDRAMG
jgi:hypothetical protein